MSARDPEAPPDLRLGAWDVLVLVGAALFLLGWWNRSLSPTTGFELYYAAEFDRGRIPYRDYFLGVTPGYPLWGIFLTRIFGAWHLPFLVSGCLFRVAATWCLHRWLLRVAAPAAAALAALVTLVASSGDVADYPGWYTYQTCIWAVLAGFCLSRAFEAEAGAEGRWVALGGLVLGLDVLTKQSNGLATLGAALLACVLVRGRRQGPKAGLALGLRVGLWAALPYALAGAWLASHGAFQDHLQQVYLWGPAGKGGLLASLTRPFTTFWRLPTYRLTAGIALVGWLLLEYPGAGTDEAAGDPDRGRQVALGIAFLLALVLGQAWAGEGLGSRFPLILAIYLGLLGCLGMGLRALRDLARDAPGRGRDHRLLMAGVGFASALASSLSWPAFEPMLLPAFGLYLATLLGRREGWVSHPLARGMGVLAALGLVALATYRKHASPFSWGMWAEAPTAAANARLSLPEFSGVLVGQPTRGIYEDLAATLRAHTAPEDPILVYPHMLLVYTLANRRPATFAHMFWIDACPDRVALRAAEEIRRAPPKAIVYARVPRAEFLFLEGFFRGGAPSGQRALVRAIEDLRIRYRVARTYRAPGTGMPIELWLRSD